MSAPGAPVTLGDGEATTSLGWLPVAMIGFGAPAVLLLTLFPSAIDAGRMVVGGMLGFLSVAAAAIYTVAVLFPGHVVGATFDPLKRAIRLVWASPFATKAEMISFADVVGLGLATRYDDDGYAEEIAELRLADGRVIPLAPGASRDDIAAARAVLGLGPLPASDRRSRRLAPA